MTELKKYTKGGFVFVFGLIAGFMVVTLLFGSGLPLGLRDNTGTVATYKDLKPGERQLVVFHKPNCKTCKKYISKVRKKADQFYKETGEATIFIDLSKNKGSKYIKELPKGALTGKKTPLLLEIVNENDKLVVRTSERLNSDEKIESVFQALSENKK